MTSKLLSRLLSKASVQSIIKFNKMENPFQPAEEDVVEIVFFAFMKALIDEVDGVLKGLHF